MHKFIYNFNLLFDRLDYCISGYASSNKIAVAVSGGSDSLAVLLVCHEWIQTRAQNYQLLALTVDHGLRKESKEEALFVKEVCSKRNIPHNILIWEHKTQPNITPISGLQEKARDSRYSLLSAACREANASILITAHHSNDQVETFWMRLQRGSGPRGLACIKPVLKKSFGYLVRPFLHVDPNVFKNLLTEKYKISWISDPSNENRAFERIRVRKAIHDTTDMTKMAIEPSMIMKTVERCQEMEAYIAEELTTAFQKVEYIENWEENTENTPSFVSYAEFNWRQFKALPLYLAVRLLQSVAEQRSHITTPSNFESGKRTYMRMMSENFIRMKGLTFHGCLISYKAKNRIQVCREKRY